jgi:hypothetical protein
MFKNIRRTLIATATALTLGLGGVVLATSAASAAPASVRACLTANLSVWVNLSAGSVAAGTTSWPLDFTNTGSRACTLYGYPGVSATNANGGQLGWLQVLNFTPSGCKPGTASLLKVYPPGQRSAAETFFSMQVCRSTKPLYQYLWVAAVQPGVGHSL